MSSRLLCVVADLVPRWFFVDKLMKLVFERYFTVEDICRNWKTVLF